MAGLFLIRGVSKNAHKLVTIAAGNAYADRMSSSSASDASDSRGTDAVAANERIRALVESVDGAWPAEAYETLLLEWADAVHGSPDQAA
jgi:hypothetical protein